MILQISQESVPMLVTLTIVLVGITFGMLAWLIHKMQNEIKRLTAALEGQSPAEIPPPEPEPPTEQF